MGCLFGLILYTVAAVISWMFVTGMSFLICACFGLAWSIKMATGVWLVLYMLFVLSNGGGKK